MSRCCGGFTAGVVPSAGDCPCLAGSASVSCPQRKGAEPHRHWLAPPRGRGPSQTPPSLATDSSISPGPPSPWLPALSPVNKQEPLVVQVPSLAQARGCKGRSPLHKKTKNPPPSRREGGRGDGGKKANQRQGWQAAKKASPPLRFPQRQSEQVPRGFSRRDAGGVPPSAKKQRLQAKKSAKKP